MHVLDMPHGMTDINVVKYQLCAEMVITRMNMLLTESHIGR